MHRWFPNAIVLTAGLISLAAFARAEITLEVTANSSEIYIGDAVLLNVTVHGTQSASAPDLSGIANCTAELNGAQRQFTRINGANRQWITYPVALTPTQTGAFVAGPIRIEVDGHVLSDPGPTIHVRGVEAQDWVTLAISASRDSVLVDESFEIELALGLRQLNPPYTDNTPLDPRDPPKLSVPFMNALPSGLAGPDMQTILQQHLVQQQDQPGFAINSFTVNVDPFANMFNFGPMGMGNQMIARFMFPRQTVVDARGSYHVYSMRFTYIAKKEGDYTFGPVEFKGRPIIFVDAAGQITTRPVLAVAPTVIVHVVPPPETGRPPSFVGAIGSNLVATASLDAQTCNVGDPLTLTLTIDGDISLQNISAPALNRQPELASRFRIYDDTVRTDSRDRGKTYRYTLRPTQAGTYELPPIAVSYYDSRARTYRTVYTDPIPIRANESAQVGGGMILSSATNATTDIAFSRAGEESYPAPITMSPEGAVAMRLMNWRVHGVAGGIGPALLALALTLRGGRRFAQKLAHTRRPRGARKAAAHALAHVARDADPTHRCANLRNALALYLGDRLQVPPQGLTPSDVHHELTKRTEVPAPLATRCCELYERLFLAQFSGDGARPEIDTVDNVRDLLDELDAAFRTADKSSRKHPHTENAA